MSDPRYSISDFACEVKREPTRAVEIGLRALRAELFEQVSPARTVIRRAREAQDRSDQVAADRAFRTREGRSR
jgi:hypothetical protein